jgi:hypothetical protein
MDVPTYPKPLFVTDAAANIFPTLEDKVDIVQNAIDLAHTLWIAAPKVAVLSAVETITSKIPSTIDAAALCKMAERGQITGAVLDGPLALDIAISREAAAMKDINSPVAGGADILIAPDLEAGNIGSLGRRLDLKKYHLSGVSVGWRIRRYHHQGAGLQRPKISRNVKRADKDVSRPGRPYRSLHGKHNAQANMAGNRVLDCRRPIACEHRAPFTGNFVLWLRQIETCRRALSPRPTQNERLAALIPTNSVSNPDRTQGAGDHRLFIAPMAKNTRPVATPHSAKLYAIR